MVQTFTAENWLTPEGTPNGGYVNMFVGSDEREALWIRWQEGPLVVDGVRHEPNGCFVETVIEAAVQRIEHYQNDTPFRCVENAEALGHLSAALQALRDRTARRQARGVEGTTEV
jgi:hypothetical protein